MQVESLVEHMQSHYASLMQRSWNTFSGISVFILALCVYVCMYVCVCVCVLVGMNHRGCVLQGQFLVTVVSEHMSVFAQEGICVTFQITRLAISSHHVLRTHLSSCPVPHQLTHSPWNVSIYCVPFTGNLLCIFTSLLHLGLPPLCCIEIDCIYSYFHNDFRVCQRGSIPLPAVTIG